MAAFFHTTLGSFLLWLGLMLPFWGFLGWFYVRIRTDQRRWAVQQQIWAMERQIWDEALSDEAREEQRLARERTAEVRREARRRLGLPEEET